MKGFYGVRTWSPVYLNLGTALTAIFQNVHNIFILEHMMWQKA